MIARIQGLQKSLPEGPMPAVLGEERGQQRIPTHPAHRDVVERAHHIEDGSRLELTGDPLRFGAYVARGRAGIDD